MNTSKKKLISVVVPVFCEEAVISETCRQLTELLESLENYQYEVILINDGSSDNSMTIIRELAKHDPHLKVISFSRNFGHQMAITAGIRRAEGDAVIIIDADLQDPPGLIPSMIHLWEQGYHVVYAKRVQRQGESWFKKTSASAFYKFINMLSDIDIPVDTGDFRLIDRKVADEMNRIGEHHRFVRGLVSWVGFRQIAVEYVRSPRVAGETKYPLRKMIHFALDGIISFSNKPLRMALNLGFCSIFIAFAVLFYGLAMHWAGHTIRGWTSTMVTILFLGGIQLFMIGVIGEYLGRIYNEIKGRPLYIVEEEINFTYSDNNVRESNCHPELQRNVISSEARNLKDTSLRSE